MRQSGATDLKVIGAEMMAPSGEADWATQGDKGEKTFEPIKTGLNPFPERDEIASQNPFPGVGDPVQIQTQAQVSPLSLHKNLKIIQLLKSGQLLNGS